MKDRRAAPDEGNRMKTTPLASAALVLFALAPSAWAQSGPADWSGFSLGANVGGADPAEIVAVSSAHEVDFLPPPDK